MQRQLYSTPKDRSTFTGGAQRMLAWLDTKPAYLDMIRRLASLQEAPRTERNLFWQGQHAELTSALSAAEDEMWEDGWETETDSVAHILMEEALGRIVEPIIWCYENTVLNTWIDLCKAHLPPGAYETARRYHRLMESVPVAHSNADLALFGAMMAAMRGGIDPMLTLEETFQRVMAAGIGTGMDAQALVRGAFGERLIEEFRAMFPDVRLEIGGAR